MKPPWILKKEKNLSPEIINSLEKKGQNLLNELKDIYKGKISKSDIDPEWDFEYFDF